jgi:hypothetical protein
VCEMSELEIRVSGARNITSVRDDVKEERIPAVSFEGQIENSISLPSLWEGLREGPQLRRREKQNYLCADPFWVSTRSCAPPLTPPKVRGIYLIRAS